MRIIIETEVLKRFGLSVEAFGLLVFCNKNLLSRRFIHENKLDNLEDYGFIDKTKKGFKLNKNRLYRVIVAMKDSVNSKTIKTRADTLAPKLIEQFPEGRKPGTNLYWRGNRMEISNKLKKFLSVYGEEFSDEQIIQATYKYVQSFNGNYSYMRVLKYFIWKNVIQVGESVNTVEEVSDLLTWLESDGQEDGMRQDWISTMV